MVTKVNARHHLHRMRGGTQSQLMFCSDGNFYVVKFQNNPQGIRVLANEMFVNALAGLLGVSVPPIAIVNVTQELIRVSSELVIELPNGKASCQAGLQFGSLHQGRVLDIFPTSMLTRVQNVTEFAGAVVLDKWTGNIDLPQAIFQKCRRKSLYHAVFLDYGLSFAGNEWRFIDSPGLGAYSDCNVYRDVTSWDSFEPWLTRAEAMDENALWQCVASVPPEWYQYRRDDLSRLVEGLAARRNRIRDLIAALRDSPLWPFRNWNSLSVPVQGAKLSARSCLQSKSLLSMA